tara:strand:+ start:4752 stop:5027 length:276 start_codon:yes stop_codon:yes gene_type:complete
MTITSEQAAKKMLINDPTVNRMYIYTNLMNGLVMFAAFEDPKHDDALVSPFVVDPVLLMDDGDITAQGLVFLTDNKKHAYEAAKVEPVTKY